MDAPKKKVAKPEPAYRGGKGGMQGFSDKGVKKPVRSTYYGKKAR